MAAAETKSQASCARAWIAISALVRAARYADIQMYWFSAAAVPRFGTGLCNTCSIQRKRRRSQPLNSYLRTRWEKAGNKNQDLHTRSKSQRLHVRNAERCVYVCVRERDEDGEGQTGELRTALLLIAGVVDGDL